MQAGRLLIAALVASSVTAAGAAHADHGARGDAYARVEAPRFVHAPAPEAFHPSSPRHWGRDGHRILPGGLSPYKAETDRNGWFLGWEDRFGNPIAPNRRFGPPAPPSPYHRPVVDANGWFLHWEDMSGDVSTHPFQASRRGRESSD